MDAVLQQAATQVPGLVVLVVLVLIFTKFLQAERQSRDTSDAAHRDNFKALTESCQLDCDERVKAYENLSRDNRVALEKSIEATTLAAAEIRASREDRERRQTRASGH